MDDRNALAARPPIREFSRSNQTDTNLALLDERALTASSSCTSAPESSPQPPSKIGDTMHRKGARTTFVAIQTEGRTPIGMFQSLSDPAMTEIIGTTGFDFVLIDGEHSPMGPAEWLPLIRTAQAYGIIPLVRLWEGSRPLIQKALDVGAEGIVVPHVETARQAADLVAATRFPSQAGVRSMCPANHSSNYSMSRWSSFVDHTNDNVLVIPIVESKVGIENLAEILAVDGIDYVYFGHADLSVDLGVSMDDPLLEQMWSEAGALAASAGKRLFASDIQPGLKAGDSGAVVCGMDSMHVVEAFTRIRSEVGVHLRS